VQAHTQQLNTEHEAGPHRNKLIGRQATFMAQPHKTPLHESTLKAERILMMDFATTQARAKGVSSYDNHEGA
jgi:hypothetical protein